MQRILPRALVLLVATLATLAQADPLSYAIIDLGVVGNGVASQGTGISANGAILAGNSLGSGLTAFTWTAQTGSVALPNLAGRSHSMVNGVNNAGVAVGTSATTIFGSNPLPVVWNQGTASALPLPEGYGEGRAFGVNAAGVAVGSVGSGTEQRAVLFSAGAGSVITATTANGSYMTTAFAINDSGLVVGSGIDPNDASLNVGLVYNLTTGQMTSVGALPAGNGALNFGVSNAGDVVGSSMLYQGDGSPFIWSAAGGLRAIGLPPGTTQGAAYGVNDQGWAVGVGGGEFSVPFLYADGTTYTLQSLLAPDSGWDFSTNTFASAQAIADDGTIVGTAVHDGLIHAYRMELVSSVPEPGTWFLMLGGLVAAAGCSRRQRQNR